MIDNGNIKPLAVSVATGKAMLGIGSTKLFALIRDGELDTFLIGRKRLIVLASIHRFVEIQRSAQGRPSCPEIDGIAKASPAATHPLDGGGQ